MSVSASLRNCITPFKLRPLVSSVRPPFSVVESTMIGPHFTQYLPDEYAPKKQTPLDERTLWTTFGCTFGRPNPGSFTEAAMLKGLSRNLGALHPNAKFKLLGYCERPCTTDNFPFIEGIDQSGRRVRLDSLLTQEIQSTPVPDNIPIVHINGGSQAGITSAPANGRATLKAILPQLKKLFDKGVQEAHITIVGSGIPTQFLLLFLSEQMAELYPGKKVVVTRISNAIDKKSTKLAAAVVHPYLTGEPYAIQIWDIKRVFLSTTPLFVRLNQDLCRFGLEYFPSKIWPPHSTEEANILVKSLAEGWRDYEGLCAQAGLESGLDSTGFVIVYLEKSGWDRGRAVIEKRGESYEWLSPSQVADLLQLPHLGKTCYGAVYIGGQSVPSTSPGNPKVGALNRSVFFASSSALIRASETIRVEEKTARVLSVVSRESSGVTIKTDQDECFSDVVVLAPGCGIKNIGGDASRLRKVHPIVGIVGVSTFPLD